MGVFEVAGYVWLEPEQQGRQVPRVAGWEVGWGWGCGRVGRCAGAIGSAFQSYRDKWFVFVHPSGWVDSRLIRGDEIVVRGEGGGK
jgi:hypothetical protein